MGNGFLKTDWKKYFERKILARGASYQKDGAVSELSYHTDSCSASALVQGADDYQVEIRFSPDFCSVKRMTCTCPYAEEGNACKHMAAVFYELETVPGLGLTAPESASPDATKVSEKEKEPSLSQIIAQLPEETVRNLLEKAAMDSGNLRDQIYMIGTGRIFPSQMTAWKKEISRIIRNISRSYDDDSNRMWDELDDLYAFLSDRIQSAVEIQDADTAFQLVVYAYDLCAKQIGNTEMLGDGWDMLWNGILEHANAGQRAGMYQWFCDRCRNCISDNNDSVVQNFLLNGFEDAELLTRTEEMLLQAIGQKNEDRGLFWLIQSELDVMQKLGKSEAEMLAFRSRYRHLPQVRQMEIEEAMRGKKYEDAVQLLTESRAMHSTEAVDSPWESTRFIEAYDRLGRKDDLLKELMAYISSCTQHDLHYIMLLKENLPTPQWQQTCQELLELSTLNRIRYDLMAQEGMYRRLMDELETDPELWQMETYEKLLKQHFPEELRDVYLAYLRAKMQTGEGRSLYHALALRLKKLKGYPDGKRLTQALADAWKQQYSRRPALMDELKKAGF